MVLFNDNLLLLSSLGSLGVIGGIVSKNSPQLVGKNSKQIGDGLFVAGWAIVLYAILQSLGGNFTDMVSIQAIVSVLAIVGSIIVIPQYAPQYAKYSKWIYSAGWLGLAGTLGLGDFSKFEMDKLMDTKNIYAMLSAALAISASIYVLPKEKQHGIIGGPAVPMYVIALGLLIDAIAAKDKLPGLEALGLGRVA